MSKPIKFCLTLFIILGFIPAILEGKDAMEISYQLSWDKPNSHLFNVSVTVKNPEGSQTLFRIPAWRPGRYVIQNYTKNIIKFAAIDNNGRELKFQKLDKDTWQVHHQSVKSVTVSYQYYANVLDAGSSFLDDSEAYINPITLAMYIPGKEMLPVSLKIDKPGDWKIATALDFDPETRSYQVENYHEFADNPILISPDFELLSFDYENAKIEMVFQGERNYDPQKVIDDVRSIVAEQSRIMGGVPCERYLFMYHLIPERMGHGVEHKNSTSIVIGPADFNDPVFYFRFLSVTSHEFFHIWNVERIRPEAIYHPDYSKENYTTTMWFFEGVTSYYDLLTMKHAGVISKYQFYNAMERTIQRLQNTYGRKITSAAMASWNSWAMFEGSPPNSSISFYNKGEILGLMLDMEIRDRTANKKSLDDVMRYLYKNYALKDKGVPETGIQSAIEYVVSQENKTRSSFADFFADYIFGTKEIDYNLFLQFAGLELLTQVDEQQPAAYLGIHLTRDEKEPRIENVNPDSPAFEAGLDHEDILLAIDNHRVTAMNLNRLLMRYQPGDRITVTVFRRSKLRHFDVTLGSGNNTRLVLIEMEKPSPAQLNIRNDWLKEPAESHTN